MLHLLEQKLRGRRLFVEMEDNCSYSEARQELQLLNETFLNYVQEHNELQFQQSRYVMNELFGEEKKEEKAKRFFDWFCARATLYGVVFGFVLGFTLFMILSRLVK